MVIETFFTTDAGAARAAVGEFLSGDPVRHNVVATLLDGRVAGSTPIRFWWATVDGEVGGALFQSPDTFPVSASLLDPAVIEPLAAEVAASPGLPIPGIDGTADSAARFAGAFATISRRPATPVEGQRIYEIERVVPPAGVAGASRVATDGDRSTIEAWLGGFATDTGLASGAAVDDAVRAGFFIGTGRLHVWVVDSMPRTSTYAQPPAANVVRVGFVYTPAAERRNGYASALVADVSQQILDAGHRCILYTQLANPTSNAIYQAVGYQPVAEIVRYRFD